MLPDDLASALRFWSDGVVAQNKKLGSMEIEVIPLEKTPYLDKDLSATPAVAKTTGKDAFGSEYSVEAESRASIQATWLPLGGSNRITAPDVRRGESVSIVRFANQDKYYWVTTILGQKLRKLETVIWAFSGTKDENAVVSPETHYFLEISTHRGQVTFHTSKANGEPYSYDLQIDTKNGKFHFQDDVSNSVYLNSAQARLKMQNTNGAFFDMLANDIVISAPNRITVNCKEYVCSASSSYQVTTQAYTVSSGTVGYNASGSFSIGANGFSVDGGSYATIMSMNTNVE